MNIESTILGGDGVSAIRSIEAALPSLMMGLIEAQVMITDASDSRYRDTGVVEDVVMCGVRKAKETTGYVGVCTVTFYVRVRFAHGQRRRFRVDQLKLVKSMPGVLH